MEQRATFALVRFKVSSRDICQVHPNMAVLLQAAVADAVNSMRDASVRRRFEKEVELTLAWEAEKMIVERFTGDGAILGLYGEPSTSSLVMEPISSLYGNNNNNEDEFLFTRGRAEYHGGNDLQEGIASQVSCPTNADVFTNKRSASVREVSTNNISYKLPDTPLEVKSPTIGNRNEMGKENHLICATCGFQGNNRKALYRHGLKTQHMLRPSNTSGSLACELCTFRTNKTYNMNRHMKRFHDEK